MPTIAVRCSRVTSRTVLRARWIVAATMSLAASTATAAQQPLGLGGFVRDQSGAPLHQAQVSVAGTSIRSFTDERGRFYLPGPLGDEVRLVVTKIGYTPVDGLVSGTRRSSGSGDIVVTLSRVENPIGKVSGPSRPLDITDDTIPHATLDRVASALGRRPLREGVRRQREPEVRIALHGGLAAGGSLLVISRRAGRAIGEAWYWWGPFDSDDSNYTEYERLWREDAASLGCPRARWRWEREIRGDTVTRSGLLACRATFSAQPDWDSLWRALDSLAVWTLPDDYEVPRPTYIVADGWTVTIEMFDGSRYRIVSYANPDPEVAAEPRRAEAIARLANRALRGVVRRPAPER